MCSCTGKHWPVDADGTEVEDGGGAQHHVHGHQPVTDGGAEGPHTILELKHTETHSVCSHTYSFATLFFNFSSAFFWILHSETLKFTEYNTLFRIKWCFQKRSDCDCSALQLSCGPCKIADFSRNVQTVLRALINNNWLIVPGQVIHSFWSCVQWGEENKTGERLSLCFQTKWNQSKWY